MNQTRLLLYHDIRSLVLSTRFAFILLAFVTTVGVLAFVGAEERRELEESRRWRSERHRQWIQNPKAYIEFVPTVELSVNRYKSIKSPTVRLGTTLVFSGWYGGTRFLDLADDQRLQDDHLLLSDLDLAHLISVILSLLVVFLVATRYSRERQDGTALMLLSQSVPRKKLVLVPYIASMITTSIALIFAISVWVLISILLGVELDFSDVYVLLLFYFASIGMLSLFILVVLNATVYVGSPGRAAVLTVLVWSLLAVCMPSVVDMVAGIVHKNKSTSRLVSESVGAVPGESQPDPDRQYRYMSMGNFHPRTSYPETYLMSSNSVAGLKTAIRRARLVRRLSWIDPVSSYHTVVASICGTDEISAKKSLDAAVAYNNAFKAWQSEKVEEYPHRSKWITDLDGILDLNGFSAPQSDDFRPTALLRRTSIPAFILFLWNALALMILLIRSDRATTWLSGT